MVSSPSSILNDAPHILILIGALGTAAFGLVEVLRILPGGGISLSGFKFIFAAMNHLIPNVPELMHTGLSRASIIYTLQSQWINEVEKSHQIDMAKSLIKLLLTPGTASHFANVTGLDSVIMLGIASKNRNGTDLTSEEKMLYEQFDIVLMSLLDQAYQRAEQRRSNIARGIAIPVSIFLAIVASILIPALNINTPQAVLLGLFATPLAPIAKNISSAIAGAAQKLQSSTK